MGSVGGCDVKDGGEGGEMMRNDSVVGMLCGRKEKDFTGVWWMKGGEIRVENGWECKRGKMEAREVIHGVFC